MRNCRRCVSEWKYRRRIEKGSVGRRGNPELTPGAAACIEAFALFGLCDAPHQIYPPAIAVVKGLLASGCDPFRITEPERPAKSYRGMHEQHDNRQWAHPTHICAGTGLTPTHICART